MKILQITSNSDPKIGGQERHVLALSKHLTKMGHDVTLLTCGASNSSDVERSFKVDTIGFSNLVGLHVLPLNKLMTFFRENKFDICHLHHETLFGEMVLFVKRKLNFPLVTTLHTTLNRSLPARFLFDQLSLRFISSSSDQVICLSQNVMQSLIKRGLDRSKCVVIPNALEVQEIEAQFEKIRNLTVENEACSDVLFVGRLEHRKGLQWLIEAFSLLHRKGKKYSLKIIGHGPMIKDLKKRISENNLNDYVSLSGYVTKQELLKSYLYTKVVVIPSLYEGLPTVALEAMAARKPLIVTNIPGLNELVVNGSNGLIVPPKDAKTLAETIDKVLFSPDQYLNSVETTNKETLAAFSWDVIVGDILKTYCEAINSCF